MKIDHLNNNRAFKSPPSQPPLLTLRVVDNSLILTEKIAWLLPNKPANLNFKIPNPVFVMRVREEREKKRLNSPGKNTEVLAIDPPRSLFKVVVNNYRYQERSRDKENEEMVETMMSDHQGLPPQPAGYLKFPEYDWF